MFEQMVKAIYLMKFWEMLSGVSLVKMEAGRAFRWSALHARQRTERMPGDCRGHCRQPGGEGEAGNRRR